MDDFRFKKYDILEYTPTPEDLKYSHKYHDNGAFSMRIPTFSVLENGLTPQRCEIYEIDDNRCNGWGVNIAVNWLDNKCRFHNAWWNIDDKRFKKIGERQIVIFNDASDDTVQ